MANVETEFEAYKQRVEQVFDELEKHIASVDLEDHVRDHLLHAVSGARAGERVAADPSPAPAAPGTLGADPRPDDDPADDELAASEPAAGSSQP